MTHTKTERAKKRSAYSSTKLSISKSKKINIIERRKNERRQILSVIVFTENRREKRRKIARRVIENRRKTNIPIAPSEKRASERREIVGEAYDKDFTSPFLIKASATVKSDKKHVFNIIKNMERFPDFMRDVKRTKIIERLNNKITIEWETDIEGIPIKWKEEVIFDEINYEIFFKMIEGDYNKYNGKWELSNVLNMTKISLNIELDWGIPTLEEYVGDTIRRKTRNALRSMLNAIRKKAENG